MLFLVERKVSDTLNANLINKVAEESSYSTGFHLPLKFMTHNYLSKHYMISYVTPILQNNWKFLPGKVNS